MSLFIPHFKKPLLFDLNNFNTSIVNVFDKKEIPLFTILGYVAMGEKNAKFKI